MSKPLLSIGMIIKNEMRCLERCLKSLEPLRAQISCQLVIADTGSTDGSRALAERYADILVDYPLEPQDFAAARNAVLER
ncbi:MAG: glycosyltransferase [Dysosmobacter sp.]